MIFRFCCVGFLIKLIVVINGARSEITPSKKDAGEPLFLTPYISSGQITEARRLAAVTNISDSIESYSGLITVDQTNGAHTFFWFFPAQNDAANAPVILWMEGGPGYSGLFSVFLEHGPIFMGDDGYLKLRETAWSVNHSVIYTDQPMDVGFSFTEQEAGYVSNGADCAPNMYNFLMQFFNMFPEFKSNDFYSAGVSFGGIYAPAIAHYIYRQNKEPSSEMVINLKGVLLESPFTDPATQLDYGAFLYHVGLIDDAALLHFTTQEELIRSLISQGQYFQAQQVNNQLILGQADAEHGTFYRNATGLRNIWNILQDMPDYNSGPDWMDFVESEHFRRSAHVGNLTFIYRSVLVIDLFQPNLLRSVKPLLEDLLNFGYKVMIVSGQFDVITNQFGVDKMVKTFNWEGAEEYANATRIIWKIDDVVAGYVKTARNFTKIVLRNAGHDAVIDQPIWTLQMLTKFINNIPFL